MLINVPDVETLKLIYESFNNFDFCMCNKDKIDKITNFQDYIKKEIEYYEED